jgi:two-component system cell cycle sensor histidine kinase/response regulator CckA
MEALGRLAGGVAHDFNNQLGVIIGFSEVLSDRLRFDESLSGFANEILRAGRQAASLTRQLLAFSRQQLLNPRVLDFNTSITDMKQLLRRLIREDIELTFRLAQDLGRVKMDLGQLEQVIMNLAVNARDAMPEGGELTIETANADLDETHACKFPYVLPGPYVRLTVRDTGIGMDNQTQAKIFEPFFTTKPVGKGTGLGLATVYGIVKQSGGYIWVESEPGKGTSFSVYFPYVSEPASHSAAERASVGTLSGVETILLVEDSEPFRRLVRMLLQSSGYNVLEAADGADATQIAASHKGPIHLLLTDVIMPQISGYRLSDHLRFLRPEMRVLCMSGYTGSASVGQVEVKAGTALLSKPFTRDALLVMVRQILDQPQSRGEEQALRKTA